MQNNTALSGGRGSQSSSSRVEFSYRERYFSKIYLIAEKILCNSKEVRTRTCNVLSSKINIILWHVMLECACVRLEHNDEVTLRVSCSLTFSEFESRAKTSVPERVSLVEESTCLLRIVEPIIAGATRTSRASERRTPKRSCCLIVKTGRDDLFTYRYTLYRLYV